MMNETTAAAKPCAARWISGGFFGLGTALFCALQFYVVYAPIARRAEPVEVDDAYSYIHKAEQMRSDFFQRSLAIEDLRRQISAPALAVGQIYERNRMEHRLFYVYHPLHSFLLMALHGAGLAWVRAFEFIQLAGILFIALGAAAWLLTMWGPGPAGCALLLLALARFKDQGFHIIVPSNLCMGMAFWVWAGVAHGGRIADWAAPVGAALMPWMHPAGKIYAILAAASYALEEQLRDRWRRIVFCITLALITIAAVAPCLITAPALRALTPDARPDTSRLSVMIAAARALGVSARHAFGGDNWLLFSASLLLAGFGLKMIPSPERRRLARTGIGAAVLALAAAPFALPLYPNAMAERFFVPVALFIFGAIGNAYWAAGAAIVKKMAPSKGPQTGDERAICFFRSESWTRACLALFLILAIYHAQGSCRYWIAERRQIMDRLVHSQPYRLAPEQVAALLQQSRAGERVIYFDEVPLYFYLTHGAAQRGAVYYPAIQETPDAQTWMRGEGAARYAVFMNPRFRLPDSTEDGFIWAPKACVEILCKTPKPLSQWMIRLKTDRSPVVIRMRAHEAESDSITTWTLRFDQPLTQPTWLPLEPTPANNSVHPVHSVHSVHLELQATNAPITISGLRTTRDSQWDWPWGEGICVRWTMDHRVYFKAFFDPEDLYPKAGVRFRVLDERGATILAEIQP